jgi:alkylated DNA repair dioxygenase AlkB
MDRTVIISMGENNMFLVRYMRGGEFVARMKYHSMDVELISDVTRWLEEGEL